MKRLLFEPLLSLLQDFWHVIKHPLFVIIMLVIGWLAFTVPDQAQDIFLEFNKIDITSFLLRTDSDRAFLVFFLLSTWLWAITTWYTTRMLLHLTHIESKNENVVCYFICWIPRVLGLLPFLIAFFSLINASQKTDDSNNILQAFNILQWNIPHWVLFLSAVAFVFLTFVRRKVFEHKTKIVIERVRWKDLRKSTRIIFYCLSFVALSAIFYFSLPYKPNGMAEKVGPASILLLGLSIWTFVGVVIIYFGFRLRLPGLLGIALLFYFSSSCNDNHEVRYAEEPLVEKNGKHKLELDKDYLRNWIITRAEEINGKSDTFNVYIIAGEGGGIRAAYWTGSVIAKFIEQDSLFYKQTFALSTVSGSSVGAAFIQALYKDYILNSDPKKRLPADSLLPKIRQMLGHEDHLSGVTAALLFPDLMQKFIPVRITQWDRARWLEDSWSAAYKKHTGKPGADGFETLDLSLMDLYKDIPPYSMPALFLNTTVSETGQKAIISNVRLSTESAGNQKNGYFSDVVDFHSLTNKAMLLKTSASASARFPLITPPATIFDSSNEPGAHFVDGGYFENTGLSTAMEILYLFNEVIDPKIENGISVETKKKIRPVILYLKNGDYELKKISLNEVPVEKRNSIAEPIRGMYEFRTIVNTFLGAWGRGGLNTSSNVNRITNKMIPKVEMITKEMKREKTVPLGWYLSDDACEYVNSQVNTIRLREIKTNSDIIAYKKKETGK